MLQAIIALYFLTVLIGGALLLRRAVQRNLPLIGAALIDARRPETPAARLSAARVRPALSGGRR